VFLFESHPPAHEGESFHKTVELLEKYFSIEKKEVLEYGSFLDRGRTFIVAAIK